MGFFQVKWKYLLDFYKFYIKIDAIIWQKTFYQNKEKKATIKVIQFITSTVVNNNTLYMTTVKQNTRVAKSTVKLVLSVM